MKNILVAAALLAGLQFGNIQSVVACDKGCTMGGSYIGVLPQFHKNFVGLRYNTRQYTFTTVHTHLHDGMPMEHRETTKEQYNTYEVWGRFYPTERIQAFIFVPYIQNYQDKDGNTTNQQGLGDITVQANYAVLNNVDFKALGVNQTLLLGGGVKLPTGAYATQTGTGAEEPSLQPGTGSLDFLASGTYTLRYQKVGFNTDFTYRFNSESRDGYRFGNRYNGSANVFYWHAAGKVSFLPSTGLYYERAKADASHDETHTQNGGGGLFGNIGINVFVKNVAIGSTIQKPMGQHQHSEHLSQSNSRFGLNVSYLF